MRDRSIPKRSVDERDQFGLATANVRPKHRVGLPQLIGVLHAEGQPGFVLARVCFEYFVFVDQPAECRAGDLIRVQQAFLDTEAVDGCFIGRFGAKVGQRRVDRFEDLFRSHFAAAPFVGARLVLHRGDAVIFIAIMPRLNGPPRELISSGCVVGEKRILGGLSVRRNFGRAGERWHRLTAPLVTDAQIQW